MKSHRPYIFNMNYVPEADIFLCASHFERTYGDQMGYEYDEDGEIAYSGIAYDEADPTEMCLKCEWNRQKRAERDKK